MKRSAYSLILMDDVVAAVDLLASQQGTSRSNYINQILAEHVRCITPEQQMRQVFDYMVQQMDSAFRIQEQGSDAMLSLFGPVQFKYRPNVRYHVELFRNFQSESAGRLKISCRTQSKTILDVMDGFFLFWMQLEQRSFADVTEDLYCLESSKMTRLLLRRYIPDEAVLGKTVAAYIQLFHSVLQTYFSGIGQNLPGIALQHTMEQQYLTGVKQMAYYL